MKKFKFMFVVGILATFSLIFSTSCSDDDKFTEVDAEITLSGNPQTLTFSAINPQSKLLSIETNATQWHVSSNVSWIRATQFNKMTILVEVDENSVLESTQRSGVITVTAEGYDGDIQFTVTQDKGYSLYGYWMVKTSWDKFDSSWKYATGYEENFLIYHIAENNILTVYVGGTNAAEYPITYTPSDFCFMMDDTRFDVLLLNHTDLELGQPTNLSASGYAKQVCVKLAELPF